MTQRKGNSFLREFPLPMLAMTREYDPPSDDKKPSTKLISLIKDAANTLLDFGELWDTIKSIGHEEGFEDKELQEMLRPFLKDKLNSKKVWYLFHQEEHKERSRENYQKSTNIRTIAAKNVLSNEGFKVPPNVPVTTPETIITKSEGEIAEAEYKKETQSEGFPFSNENRDRQLTLDEIFKFLPDDDGMTSWKHNEISGTALKNRISSWQGNSTKFFRVWLQEITK